MSAVLAMQIAGEAVVVPPMRVIVRSGGTYFSVCGQGSSSAVAGHAWTLTVEGARTNGVIFDFRIGTSATFDECMSVPKMGAAAGGFTATISYTGAGTDAAGAFAGYGAWVPGSADQTGDGGITFSASVH